MAKFTLTLEDADDDGGIACRVEFDPPLTTEEVEATPAQCEGAFILEVLQRRASGQSLDQIADEMDEDEYPSVGGYEPEN